MNRAVKKAPIGSYGRMVADAGGRWEGDRIEFTPASLIKFSAIAGKFQADYATENLLGLLQRYVDMGIATDKRRGNDLLQLSGLHRDAVAAIAKAKGAAK